MSEGLATFWEHVEELRSVIIRAFVGILCGVAVSFYFHQEIVRFLIQHTPNAELFLFGPVDGFIAVFRLSFWLGVLGTSPYWLSGLIRFVTPAFKKDEKRWVPVFFLLSGLFISIGCVICIKFTLPLASNYLYAFNGEIGSNLWGFTAYLDFVLMLLFSHGIAFELGALLLFLIHLEILNGAFLVEKRRHAMVGALVVGALLTPPDILTQLFIAIPLYGFYELGILYSRYISRKNV